jgi:hypothetical protein
MCFGGPILSFISEKSKNYLGTITSAAFVMSLIFIILLLNIMTVSTISISLIIVGICCAYQILAIYKASTYVKEEVAGLTTAIANMIIMIFGYGFHSVIGLVIKLMGGTATKSAFIGGISVIPITLTISVIGLTILMYNDRSSVIKKA